MRALLPGSIVALCLGTLAGSAETRAEEEAGVSAPLPPGLRLHVAAGLGAYLSQSMREPDGSQASATCSQEAIRWLCTVSPALGFGIDWSPVDPFGLGLRGRWVHAVHGNATIFGRQLDVFEALLVPQVRLPWRKGIPRGGARPYVAAPVGLAWSFQSRKWERAVREDWNARPGLSAGAALGLELFWGRRWGTLVELDYRARFLSADVVSTPLDEPASKATLRVTATQHQIVFSVGLLFGWARAPAEASSGNAPSSSS